MENWKQLTNAAQALIASKNEANSTKIYNELGKETNPIPKNVNCIVYCHGTNVHGWTEINNPDELGLEALIAQSWIKIEDLN